MAREPPSPAVGDVAQLVRLEGGPAKQPNVARVADIVEELAEDARFIGRAAGEKLDKPIAAAVEQPIR